MGTGIGTEDVEVEKLVDSKVSVIVLVVSIVKVSVLVDVNVTVPFVSKILEN